MSASAEQREREILSQQLKTNKNWCFVLVVTYGMSGLTWRVDCISKEYFIVI